MGHPNLEDRQQRQRHRRELDIIGVLVAVYVIALVYVLSNAGHWGVPMFGYTDEFGSTCKNNLLGRTCTPLTLAEIEARAQIDLPDDTRVLLGTWHRTHDYQLDARVLLVGDSVKTGRETLGKTFGECKPGVPNPLRQIQGLKDVCTMTNVGRVLQQGAQPDPRIWQVSVGTQPDGGMLAHLDIRSR